MWSTTPQMGDKDAAPLCESEDAQQLDTDTYIVDDCLTVMALGCESLDRHALGQITRLVHIRAARAGRVIGQQLQRHHVQQR